MTLPRPATLKDRIAASAKAFALGPLTGGLATVFIYRGEVRRRIAPQKSTPIDWGSMTQEILQVAMPILVRHFDRRNEEEAFLEDEYYTPEGPLH
jgi:hypothetical protein